MTKPFPYDHQFCVNILESKFINFLTRDRAEVKEEEEEEEEAIDQGPVEIVEQVLVQLPGTNRFPAWNYSSLVQLQRTGCELTQPRSYASPQQKFVGGSLFLDGLISCGSEADCSDHRLVWKRLPRSTKCILSEHDPSEQPSRSQNSEFQPKVRECFAVFLMFCSRHAFCMRPKHIL